MEFYLDPSLIKDFQGPKTREFAVDYRKRFACVSMHIRRSNDDAVKVIGGTKGHVEETITGYLLELYKAYDWRMIPKCTGRYTCKNPDTVSQLTPAQLLDLIPGVDCTLWKEYEFKLPGRSDKVHVVPLDNENRTGIISYVKESQGGEDVGTRYVHTLNSQSGFRRKLEAIGLIVTESDITGTQ